MGTQLFILQKVDHPKAFFTVLNKHNRIHLTKKSIHRSTKYMDLNTNVSGDILAIFLWGFLELWNQHFLILL